MRLKKVTSLLLAVPLFISACGKEPVVVSQNDQVAISLSWWGNDQRNEYTIEAVKQFEQIHPDIKVNCSYSEWSGYQVRNNVRMVSDTEADVMLINYAWIQQYSPDGNGYYDISTLGDYIDLSCFTDGDLDYGMQNGRLNAVPTALNTQTVYINKTVYDKYGIEIPETWDDLFNAAKIMNGEVYPVSMTAKPAWFYIISYAEQQSGKQFMSFDGELMFDPDDIKLMLEFYKKLIQEKVMPQVEYFDKNKISSGDYAGVVAWLSDGASYFDGAEENGFEYIVADYTCSENGNPGDGWYAKPATMYAISRNTEYPEESAMLLDFLLNSTEMAELQGTEKGIPISTAARSYLSENNMLEGMQYDAYVMLEDHSQDIDMVSPYFENTDLIDEFNAACNEVLYDKSSSEAAADELYEKFKEILE
ncbi:MAG: ABC transporter substrate-binding protein [Porcipelethomonas sp.]